MALALALSTPAAAAVQTECADMPDGNPVTVGTYDLSRVSHGGAAYTVAGAGSAATPGDQTLLTLEAQLEDGSWQPIGELTGIGDTADGYVYPLYGELDVSHDGAVPGAIVRARLAVSVGAGVTVDDACVTVWTAAAPALQTVAISQAGSDNDVDTSGGGGSGGTVSLDSDASARLDLIWIGIWMAAGLTLGVWFAPKVWGELGQWFHFRGAKAP